MGARKWKWEAHPETETIVEKSCYFPEVYKMTKVLED